MLNISDVHYINEVFSFCENHENMPVSFYIDELRNSIIELSELMLLLDRDDREKISSIMVNVSSAHLLLSRMKEAVLEYAAHNKE